jgi:hypothetical protein
MSHGIDRMDEDGQEFSQNLSEASSSSARLFAILPINYKIIRHDSTPSSLGNWRYYYCGYL